MPEIHDYDRLPPIDWPKRWSSLPGSRKTVDLCRRFTLWVSIKSTPSVLLWQNDAYTYPDFNLCMYTWGAGCDTGVSEADCVNSSNSTEGGIAGGFYYGKNERAIPTWARLTDDVSNHRNTRLLSYYLKISHAFRQVHKRFALDRPSARTNCAPLPSKSGTMQQIFFEGECHLKALTT